MRVPPLVGSTAILASVSCVGSTSADIDTPATDTESAPQSEPETTVEDTEEPIDLGIFRPAVPEGALKLVEVQVLAVSDGEFGAYGVVHNTSTDSACFVNVTLDLESNSGLPLGGWTESTWSTVRRIDRINTVTCIEPDQTGWFYAWDWENEHRFDDIGLVRYSIDSMPLTTFDPDTEVIVLPNQVDISEGASTAGSPQVDIVASIKNVGDADATFTTPFVGFALLFDADGGFIEWCSCDANGAGFDWTLPAEAVTPVECHALGAPFPAEVQFSLSWD